MLLIPRGLGSDADHVDFLARVAGNGGTLSTTAKLASRRFVYRMKQANLWKKLARVNLMIGDFAAMPVPLKVGTGANALDVNTGFVSGNWTESSGLLLAASKHLETGLTPANAGMSSGNGHIGVYVTTRANGTWVGSATTGLSSLQVNFGNFIAGISNETLTVAGTPDAKGHLMANAISGALNGYRKGCGAQVQDGATTGAVGTSTFAVGALNTGGVYSAEPANGRLAGYHIGQALTKRECRTMGRIWQAFQVEMGRAYVEGGSDIVMWGDSLTTGKLNVGMRAALTTSMVVDRGVVGQTATQIADRMVVGDDTLDDCINIFLLGKNDFNNIAGANAINTTVQDTVIAQIARCVAYLNAQAPKNLKYLVLATLNGRGIAGDVIGQNNYQNYIEVFNNRSDALSKTYAAANYADGKSRYRDTRSFIVSQFDSGTPQDVTDHTNDVPPSTKMGDTIHWNSTGWNLEAAALSALISSYGW